MACDEEELDTERFFNSYLDSESATAHGYLKDFGAMDSACKLQKSKRITD